MFSMGRAGQEQPTLWRVACDFARTARRRPCDCSLANGTDSLSETEERVKAKVEKESVPLHPSWDTVGSPAGRAQGTFPLGSNRGGVVGPAEPGGKVPCARAGQEQPTL